MEDLRLDFAERSDVGRRRPNNEDSILSLPDRGIFCVCDGMGGTRRGEVASRAITQALAAAFTVETASSPLPDKTAIARKAIEDANRAIREEMELTDSDAGSTASVMILETPTCRRGNILHIGDSRVYCFRKGKLQPLTKDHSISAEMGMRKEKLPAMFRGMLTRAVGMMDNIQLDEVPFTVAADDVFLLCSDGLTTLVKERAIAKILRASQDARSELADTTMRLVVAANEAGGNDNISVILVKPGTEWDVVAAAGSTATARASNTAETRISDESIRSVLDTRVPVAGDASGETDTVGPQPMVVAPADTADQQTPDVPTPVTPVLVADGGEGASRDGVGSVDHTATRLSDQAGQERHSETDDSTLRKRRFPPWFLGALGGGIVVVAAGISVYSTHRGREPTITGGTEPAAVSVGSGVVSGSIVAAAEPKAPDMVVQNTSRVGLPIPTTSQHVAMVATRVYSPVPALSTVETRKEPLVTQGLLVATSPVEPVGPVTATGHVVQLAQQAPPRDDLTLGEKDGEQRRAGEEAQEKIREEELRKTREEDLRKVREEEERRAREARLQRAQTDWRRLVSSARENGQWGEVQAWLSKEALTATDLALEDRDRLEAEQWIAIWQSLKEGNRDASDQYERWCQAAKALGVLLGKDAETKVGQSSSQSADRACRIMSQTRKGLADGCRRFVAVHRGVVDVLCQKRAALLSLAAFVGADTNALPATMEFRRIEAWGAAVAEVEKWQKICERAVDRPLEWRSVVHPERIETARTISREVWGLLIDWCKRVPMICCQRTAVLSDAMLEERLNKLLLAAGKLRPLVERSEGADPDSGLTADCAKAVGTILDAMSSVVSTHLEGASAESNPTP